LQLHSKKRASHVGLSLSASFLGFSSLLLASLRKSSLGPFTSSELLNSSALAIPKIECNDTYASSAKARSLRLFPSLNKFQTVSDSVQGFPMTTKNKTDRAAWLQGPPANCSPHPENIAPRWRLILLGAPGVGKGTQAQLLHQCLHACHLSTGDVFRAATRSDCVQSPAMKEALEYMRRGALVPDTTVWDMVRERAGCLRCLGGFLLDGFPRTLAQAEALNKLMREERLALNAVVNYELPVDEIVARLSGRRTCEKCKAVFHVTQQPPRVQCVCDHCGGVLVQREDDRPESVAVRLEVYERSTTPLIRYYKKLGLLLPVPAAGSPEDICARTIAALGRLPEPATP
jgi:adenylate kinase